MALAGIYRKMTFDLFGFLIDVKRILEAEGNLSRTTLQRWLPCGFLPFSARKKLMQGRRELEISNSAFIELHRKDLNPLDI